jgi:hypothetical protein
MPIFCVALEWKFGRNSLIRGNFDRYFRRSGHGTHKSWGADPSPSARAQNRDDSRINALEQIQIQLSVRGRKARAIAASAIGLDLSPPPNCVLINQ